MLQKRPTAFRLQRYYRTLRPVLPVQAAQPAPATGRSRRNPTKAQTPAVLPVREPVLPMGGTTALSYRLLLATPTEAPGPMTHARAKLLQAKVKSLLSSCDFG